MTIVVRTIIFHMGKMQSPIAIRYYTDSVSHNPPDINVNLRASPEDMLLINFYDNETNKKIRYYRTSVGSLPSVDEAVYFKDFAIHADDIENGEHLQTVDETELFIVKERVFCYSHVDVETDSEEEGEELTVTGVDIYVEPSEEE